MTKKSTSPVVKVPEIVKAEETVAYEYEFKLQFNSKAEFFHLEHPEGMTVAQINNHLAVVSLWLAQLLAEGKEKLG